MLTLTKEEAIKFFAEFYRGAHHIPGPKCEPKKFGSGWKVNHSGDLSTFDFDGLTRLVLMAHNYRYRVGIQPANFNTVVICIHRRQEFGDMTERHPTIEEAINKFNFERPKEYQNDKP